MAEKNKVELNNIYIISNQSLSLKSAGTTRMLYYSKAISNDSTRVFLVTCSYQTLRKENFVEIHPNVFVLKEEKPVLSFSGTYKFIRNLWKFANSQNGNKSFLLYPTAIISLEVVSLLFFKGIKRVKLFYELNEVRKYSSAFSDKVSLDNIGYSVKKVIFKAIFNISQILLSRYDGLICISTAIEGYGKNYNSNTIRIPILTDPEFTPITTKNVYHSKNSFNIGFSGSIHPVKEDLDNFITIINNLKNEGYNLTFNLCGPISKTYKRRFLELCSNLHHLNYYGFLNSEELSTFLNQQNLLVLPRGYTEQNNYGFSTKLSDYLNHEKMVIVTDISDNSLYIKDNENGFVVAPDNKHEMFEKIKYIINNDKGLNNRIVSNAKKTSIESFDYKLYSNKLRLFLTN